MRGISGENSPSTRWTRSSHRAPTGSRPPISPLTRLSTSKSFSWTFAIDVDTALGAVAQFETFDEKLTQADTFIRGALGLMSHQSARCVFDILLDYSRLSDACDTVNHQADKLNEALSTYGAAMNNVRNKYKDLIAFAQTAGLSVVGDYTNCTVTLDASGSSQQDFMYGLAQSALKNAKSLQKMAEHEFATALNDVDTTLWEKTLTSLIDQLKDTYIPNPERPLSSLPGTIGSWLDLTATGVRAALVSAYNGQYVRPSNFAELSPWGKTTAKGDLSNWTRYARHHAGEAPKIPGAVEGLEKVGKVAGVVAAVAEGGINAYNSYQSDTINHPDMGEGEKITRAGVRGVATGPPAGPARPTAPSWEPQSARRADRSVLLSEESWAASSEELQRARLVEPSQTQ